MRIKNKRIITIYSPQGGSGKTTLSLVTASISAQSGEKSLLIDAAIYGSFQAAFHLPGTEGEGLEAAISQNEIGRTKEEIKEYLEKHIVQREVEKNLFVLTNSDPVAMDKLREKEAETILDIILSLDADTIIADTSSELSEFNLMLMEKSRKVIVPINADISSVYRYRAFHNIYKQAGLDENKLEITLNMTHKLYSLRSEEAEERCQSKVIANIPDYGEEFRRRNNEGISPLKMGLKIKKTFTAAAETILNNNR